jgi:urea transport system substrate-binding protein
MNYSIAEEEISTIGSEFLEGHYGAWNYMMSIDTPCIQEVRCRLQGEVRR